MKLQDAIIDGKFCGLNTVKECYQNAIRFIYQLFPYHQAPHEEAELHCEFVAYEEGYLGIDWEFVDSELERLDRELEEYNEKHPPCDVDFDL
jgi:hypothetical protein